MTIELLLPALLVALAVLILLLPHSWGETTDFLSRRSGFSRSALYTYRYGPGYERLEFDGLRRLQYSILDLINEAWATLRGDLLRRLVNVLRQRIGL